jgi:hypothetical protein
MQAILPASAGAQTELSASRVRFSIKRWHRGACYRGVVSNAWALGTSAPTIRDFINTGI